MLLNALLARPRACFHFEGIAMKGKDSLSIKNAILWVFAWFGFMVLYTAVDVVVWRKFAPGIEPFLNVITISLCSGLFLRLLLKRNKVEIQVFGDRLLPKIAASFGCVALLYVLLDKGLDPILEAAFPQSEEQYQEMLRSLNQAPLASLIQVCILAPVVEETLMRGFLLGGLAADYGEGAALVISAVLFALLHFNMVQTLSALVCGMVLGLLYLRTESLFCCVITHMGYNLISLSYYK